MRRSLSLVLALAIVAPLAPVTFASTAHADPQPATRMTDAQLQAAIDRQRTRLMNDLKPELRTRVVAAAKLVVQKLTPRGNAKTPDPLAATTSVVNNVQNFPNLGNYSAGDIEALCFIVLMQAAKDAQDDLQSIMASVKAINEAKECLRANKNRAIAIKCLDKLQPTAPLTAAQLASIVDKAKNDIDSLSEMGEMESLRLQMAMDRKTKLMDALSNILKKISDTSDGIVQNMK